MNRSSKALSALLALAVASTNVSAQHAHADASAAVMSNHDMSAMAAHMAMTPRRRATTADSIRAKEVAANLRSAISKYRDVRVAEADGFRKFAPQLKNQRVYHFTKNLWALENQFTFNAGRPTSLLYRKDARGSFAGIPRIPGDNRTGKWLLLEPCPASFFCPCLCFGRSPLARRHAYHPLDRSSQFRVNDILPRSAS